MKKLSNTEAELKKALLIKKHEVSPLSKLYGKSPIPVSFPLQLGKIKYLKNISQAD